MKILRSNQGLTLFMVIFVMAFFLLFVTGSLVFSQLELKKTSNLQLATQAIEVADAGLQHALASIPWVWNFNPQLSCAQPPCTVAANSSFPSGSRFSYTVTAQNDLSDGGGANADTNNIIVLASRSSGPDNATKLVQAYVRRSSTPFRPPAALYINAASASPQADSSNSSANGFFDLNDNIRIIGNDTNTNNTAGSNGFLGSIATTNSTVTAALTNEYQSKYSTGLTGVDLHDIYHGNSPGGTNYLGVNLGPTVEPSVSTVGDDLDVIKTADTLANQPGAVKYLYGLRTDSTTCPSTTPCQLGASLSPQITYIRETYDTDMTSLKGYVTGYGVLVLEGRPIIGENFKFYGLIVHKRPNGSSYVSFEDSALIYGAVLLGAYDENDGKGAKVRFGVKDNVRILYSSQALAPVDNNWGSLLPKPPRIFAWVDK